MENSHTSTSPKCRICQERHFLKFCPRFLGMPVPERREVIRTRGFCYNCLCTGHTREWCRSRGRCLVCQKGHHTLVHVDQQPTPASSHKRHQSNKPKASGNSTRRNDRQPRHKETIVNRRQRSHFNERLSQRRRTHVFLPTALARAVTSKGPAKVRLLLSSGLTETLALPSLVDRLRLHTIKRNHQDYCTVNLESYHDPLIKIQMTCRIQSSFPTALPKCTNEPKLRNIYTHLTDLADPHYYQPKDIEILVGNDQLPKILRAGLIQTSSNMPIAQNTIFGWTISGAHQY
ncbi:uncharacterized protein LOC142222805 [Haematobia irritans]|uniref:uncharacterized protein LOC142222805 n=1 Tax=Haematobia irritans TaxID=7368 RepID=UPI003F4FED52